MVDAMQTRAELYATIGYHDYEALDASIVDTIIPHRNAPAPITDFWSACFNPPSNRFL